MNCDPHLLHGAHSLGPTYLHHWHMHDKSTRVLRIPCLLTRSDTTAPTLACTRLSPKFFAAPNATMKLLLSTDARAIYSNRTKISRGLVSSFQPLERDLGSRLALRELLTTKKTVVRVFKKCMQSSKLYLRDDAD